MGKSLGAKTVKHVHGVIGPGAARRAGGQLLAPASTGCSRWRRRLPELRRPGHRQGRGGPVGAPYGAERILLSYESRTGTADEQAGARLRRYWMLLLPFVFIVMRPAVLAMKWEAERPRAKAGELKEAANVAWPLPGTAASGRRALRRKGAESMACGRRQAPCRTISARAWVSRPA